MTTLLNAPTEELVRSRYAVRVGDIDVLVISDGERRVVRGYPPAVSVRGAGGGWGCVSLGGGVLGLLMVGRVFLGGAGFGGEQPFVVSGLATLLAEPPASLKLESLSCKTD